MNNLKNEEEELQQDGAKAHGDSAEQLLERLRFYHPEKNRAGVQDMKFKRGHTKC